MGRGPEAWRSFLEIDLVPRLLSCGNEAIGYFVRRDLLDEDAGPVSTLWGADGVRKLVRKQNPDGSFRYPGGKDHVRSREDYDQLETFRQEGVLVEKFGLTREHPSIARAADFLFSFQTEEGDFRGIYANQYATTYVGAILELLVKAGFEDDPRIGRAFDWLLSMRQNDGGWAIPLRTVGAVYSEMLDVRCHPDPVMPDKTKPSSHLVTGMVLRGFAAPRRMRSPARSDSGVDRRVDGMPR